MQLRFAPTEEDWRNALQAVPKSGWNTFQFVLSFVPMFLLGMVLTGEGFSGVGWLCIGLSVAVALAGYEVPRLLQRRLFRTSPSVQGERLLTFNDEGITTTLPFGQTQYEWKGFTRYHETKAIFVLFMSPHQMGLWVPKRVMTPAQIEELRRVLHAKMTPV